MTSITTRAGKGTPLTHTEVDDNFTNLNADKLEASNNLSDVSSASAARTNLGLGTAATTASTAYATAAQGSLADSALQSGDNVSALTNDAGYTTNVGDITGVTAGSGITGGGTSGTVTINHADTSSQASVNNSGGTVIQDITLDTYGHLTGITSYNLDGRYYTESEADSRFVNATGDTITGDVYFNATTHWAVSASDAARQRADARDDATNFSRLHWYGHSDTGGTSNFRHAWYDGSNYVNVTVTSGRIDFTGSASSMYIGNDRVFDDGYHPNADKWTTARTLSLTGDASGSVSWDGSGNASLSVTVADDSHNHIIANVDGLQTALDEKWSKGADIGGGVNLNTYATDGYYHQNSNANASSGSNYPVALAGMLEVTSDGSMVYQRYTTYSSVHTVYVRTYYNGTWYNWAKQWDNLNDGSGSGLDADLLDGQQGSYYYPASNPNGYTAYTNSDVDTHLNTGTATTDQVLSWNGTDYDWIDGGGAPPTDLHAVGTYTVACTGVNVAQGGTTAGSNLRYRNIYALDRFTVLTTTSSTVTLTGTWRNVGGPVQYVSGRGGGQRGVSLWVRIS